MAKVKIEEIIDHLSQEMRYALETAVSTVMPDADVDAYELFLEFKRNVGRRCSTWEKVPDRYIKPD